MISAFSGKPLSREMAGDKNRPTWKYRYTWSSGNREPDMDTLRFAGDSCLEEEKSMNPLLLGKINYRVELENGQIVKVTKKHELHAMSDRFQACVSEQLNNITVDYKHPLKLDLTF